MPKLTACLQLMRVDKPIGTLLTLWPTLWALWIAAGGFPGWRVMLIFTLGAWIMRSAGCVLNDFFDRNFDGDVQRTAQRPLVAGTVSLQQALMLFFLLCSLGLILVLLLNRLSLWIACLAVITLVIYPLCKRITYFPQLMLGISFYMGIPMAFAAVQNRVPMIAYLLYLAAICWAVAYDTMYAMVDREDDIKIGIKSTAILFASLDKFYIACFQCIFLLLMLAVGTWFKLGFWYYLGLATASLYCLYQHYLIHNRQAEKCFQAFINNNYAGMAIFIGISLAYS